MNDQADSILVRSILIIEDDVSILRGLKDNLSFEGYSVLTSPDGQDGLQMAIENQIDLLLLDIMLPGINGYDICRRLKKEKPELPIIMITARGTEIDKVAGLDLGADDYITKPFSIPELLARVRAVFRRTHAGSKDIAKYSFGDVSLDFKKFQALINDIEVKLSSREFAIMKYLIEHEGEVIHRHDLLDKVWGYDVIPSTRTVDNYILELRKKFEKDPTNPKHITSIRGAGYKFEA
ncbi:MAG: response regulator transcription factor [Bacteroidetes bacterium]|nr:response regulator transcription factor [Bacteroidota bacterium]